MNLLNFKKWLMVFFVLMFLLMSKTIAFAQEQKYDLIVKNDGTKIQAVVIEVDIDVVKYKAYNNQSGPIYVIKKDDIGAIKYVNGSIDFFDNDSVEKISQESEGEKRNFLAPVNTIRMPDTEIYVSENDEAGWMKYSVAKSSCACKGKGWRLPTIAELKIIYGYKDMIGNFSDEWYWALDQSGSFSGSSYYFNSRIGYGNTSYSYRFYNLNFRNGKIDDEEEGEENKVRCIWSTIKPE